jgi:hypothetical protein
MLTAASKWGVSGRKVLELWCHKRVGTIQLFREQVTQRKMTLGPKVGKEVRGAFETNRFSTEFETAGKNGMCVIMSKLFFYFGTRPLVPHAATKTINPTITVQSSNNFKSSNVCRQSDSSSMMYL